MKNKLETFKLHDTAPQAAQVQSFNGNGHLVEVRQAIKTFDSPAGRFTALKGIDLDLNQGEFVAIVGKSGSGKSTLLNILTGIDRPTTGEVLVGGAPISRLTEDQIARWRGRTVGVVFQFFQLLPTLTVIENVMLPMDFCNTFPGRERQARAMQLLDKLA